MDIRGELIRQLRLERGWTQQQLAELADLSLRTVQRVENQNTASNETVSALSAVLERPREELLSLPLSADRLARIERRVAWVLPAATGAGTLLGSLGTWALMRWLGG